MFQETGCIVTILIVDAELVGRPKNVIHKWDCPLLAQHPLIKPTFDKYDKARENMLKIYVKHKTQIRSECGEFLFCYFFLLSHM